MNLNVLSAVLKRNLVSYFSSPTGYVFIWVFVFLSAIAAFFPDEFFNANLANLDQLNKWFPFIMLFFVPAITMSIWAEEVRQGTDELLLTMPATDFDIVLGKYLAAVSIYTVALLISMASNYFVLSRLGSPDIGLYLCTHVGYWLLGLAMLAVGMVASFVTRNLTVAYILGALFNAPLAMMSRIDITPGLSRNAADAVREWSFGGQCEEFGRGILSLSGIFYFLFIAGIMLYLSIVLIGRRHWARSDDAGKQTLHFAVRCAALVAMAVAAVFFMQNHDLRRDATSERLTSLSPVTVALVSGLKDDFKKAQEIEGQMNPLEKKTAQEQQAAKETAEAAKAGEVKTVSAKSTAETPIAKIAGESASPKTTSDAKSTAAPAKVDEKKLAEKKPQSKSEQVSDDAMKLAQLKAQFDLLKVQGPVRIDAYVSPEVPESYVQTRINLLNVLREFKILGGDMMELNINEIDPYDPLAEVAKSRYGIVPREVFGTRNGAFRKDKIFLGVAFTCGLEKVVLPFIDRGLPPEYELVRSLCTVTKQKRKRIGVLDTDAHVMGNFTMQGMTPKWRLIQELEKQYEVVQVNPADLMAPPKPGEDKRYDVLLAIQPSAMGPREMESFVAAVRMGQPTVIFEDPFLFTMGNVPGTYQPRRQQSPMMGFGQENQEKGDIRALWQVLGIDFSDGGSADFDPMGGGRPQNSGTERIVWQRYNPYPKFGNTIPPEYIFIDSSCGANPPFSDKDEISSKLQHLLMFGPGFIEDTPASVKRLIAKWYNHQYSRKLNKSMAELADNIEKAQDKNDEEEFDKYVDQFVDAKDEYDLVSGGGDGKLTIQPGKLQDDTNLEQLVTKLLGKGHNRALDDLVNDLKNRFPLPVADDESEESRAVLLSKEEADKIDGEVQRLQQDSERLAREAAVLKSSGSTAPLNARAADRCARASTLKAEAAKLKQAEARMTTEGISLMETATPDDLTLFKHRIIWTDQAASLKDQAAELLSKTGQKPEVAFLDEDTANSKVMLAGFKELLAGMKTVGDVIKYAQQAVALQMVDRKFEVLVQTGPNGGTIPVSRLIEGGRLSEARSLFYQPSQGQSYVLAAHIQGKPRDRMAGAPINVVLVADVDGVNDDLFEMREKGKFPGQDIEYDFDNVTFVLNALDSLAGDERFLEIRKRRPQHRTLARFEEQTKDAREDSSRATEQQREQHDEVIRSAEKGLEAIRKRDQQKIRKQRMDENAAAQLLAQDLNNLGRQLEEKKADSDSTYDRELDKINDDLERKILSMQATYKLWAVIVPPIPLLLVAAAVFFYRRSKEREGVSSKRLR